MISFSTSNGDVELLATIAMVADEELLRQKVERVLGTNLGEWSYDPNEGIDFSVILKKNPDEGEVRATIEEALKRIDATFVITDFDLTMDGRNAVIDFTAINGEDVTVGGVYTYGG